MQPKPSDLNCSPAADDGPAGPFPPALPCDLGGSAHSFRTSRSDGQGGGQPFDDAYVIVKDAVLPGGMSRSWRGYVVFRKGEDSAIARWHGGDSAMPERDTGLEGSWKFVAGTGRFGDIRGGGTFQARAAEPGQFAFEWKGRFELGVPAGARRTKHRRAVNEPA